MENKEIEENEEINLIDIWDIFKRNIKLFLISIFVAFSIAAIYLFIAEPEYSRKASILIKDEQEGSSIGTSVSQNFEDLGLFQSNTNVDNEINILQTVSYMEEVVNKLDLDYHYSKKRFGLKTKSLYKSSPFKVKIDSSLDNIPFSFKIEFISSTEYKIEDLVFNEIGEDPKEITIDKKIIFGDNVNTPYGKFYVSKTPYFIEDISLGETYNFSKSTVRSTAKACLSNLSVSLRDKKSTVIDLNYNDSKPKRADDILNTLISVYNKNWIIDKNTITLNTSDFINDRLKVIERELGKVDNNISKFKSENLIPDIQAVTQANLTQAVKNKDTQIELNNQLAMASYIQDYLKDETKRDELLPDNTGLEQKQVNSQINKYNDLLLQKNILAANSSINNPVVSDMIISLNSMKKVINRSISDLINTLKIQIKNSEKEELINTNKLKSSPEQAKELLSVERQQKIKEELYLFLLQQRESNQLSLAFTAYKTKILSLSDGSSNPIAPKKPLIVIIALIFGIIVPAVYLYLDDLFDTLVKSKKDLEPLNIPILGTIPLLEKKQIDEVAESLLNSNSRNRVSEAFRVLRTNLDFILPSKNKSNIIQTISINPRSGKSFFSFNIALSMVLKGSKVLIIDVDMRRATLSKTHFRHCRVGLSHYLSSKESNIDEIIKHSDLTENLDVIPVGKIPPNPSELLLSEKFSFLLTEMRKRYDYIFLDSTPVEIIPDSAIVGQYCDTTIFLVRAGLLDKRMLPEVKAIYDSKKYKNMCLLLNSVEYTESGYYRYKYDYDYNTEETN